MTTQARQMKQIRTIDKFGLKINDIRVGDQYVILENKITVKAAKSNKFNTFFVNIGKEMSQKIPKTQNLFIQF